VIRSSIGVIALWLSLSSPGVTETGTAQGNFSLVDLVREVKVALLQVSEATEAQDLPKLDNAVLVAKTTMKEEADGKVSLWVVEVGAGQAHEYASTVTLTLKPPAPGSSSSIAVVNFAPALREAILAGARAIRAAGMDNPPLVAEKLEATLTFAIERDANGKIAAKFPPFELSAGGSLTSNEVQTITVTYKK
jgi:hypothetical protein